MPTLPLSSKYLLGELRKDEMTDLRQLLVHLFKSPTKFWLQIFQSVCKPLFAKLSCCPACWGAELHHCQGLDTNLVIHFAHWALLKFNVVSSVVSVDGSCMEHVRSTDLVYHLLCCDKYYVYRVSCKIVFTYHVTCNIYHVPWIIIVILIITLSIFLSSSSSSSQVSCVM